MSNENVPTPASPERPPLAPYDPPDPAPQAAAWRQALKVVCCEQHKVYSDVRRRPSFRAQ